MRKVWRLSCLLAVLGLVGSAPGASAAVVPVLVIGGTGSQFLAFGAEDYLAWAYSPNRDPAVATTYVKRLSDGKIFRVNAASTLGFPGGFEPGTNRLIYQQIEGSRSDLWFYDADSRTRRKVRGVNSAAWEWIPRISSSYILFARDRKTNGVLHTDILLLRRSNGVMRKLGSWETVRFSALTGSVGDRYASWSVCTAASCSAFIYDADTRVTKKIPTKNGRPQYAPTVDETQNLVYFVRSGFDCGVEVNIWRLPVQGLKDTPKKIVDLFPGVDTGYEMSLWDNAESGERDLLFQRFICGKSTSDIYAAQGVDTI